MKHKVSLTINGRPVRLNGFVAKALRKVVEGFISALDDVPETKERIEITISAEELNSK